MAVLASLTCTCAAAPYVIEPVAPLRTEAVTQRGSLDVSARFGPLFCAVLNHLPEAAEWGYCDRYFAPTGTPSALEPTLSVAHRVLVVPGIFGQCVEDIARPFEDASTHLKSVHGIDMEYVSVTALGSAKYNAAQIARYLEAQFSGSDTRPYIVFGYSKGASDVLEAMQTYDIARTRIAAVVTIAGSVLGSRLADGVPRGLLNALQRVKLGSCDIGDGGGIDSLRRSERAQAMSVLTLPASVALYSIPAASTQGTTSAVLMSSWNRLRLVSLEEDSQMIHEDAIIPGAHYLGLAKGDHWAVALPFEDAAKTHPELAGAIKRLIDKNHYPRAALIEAALRFVVSDLRPRPRASGTGS